MTRIQQILMRLHPRDLLNPRPNSTLGFANRHLGHGIALGNGINHIGPFGDFTEDRVFAVEMGLG